MSKYKIQGTKGKHNLRPHGKHIAHGYRIQTFVRTDISLSLYFIYINHNVEREGGGRLISFDTLKSERSFLFYRSSIVVIIIRLRISIILYLILRFHVAELESRFFVQHPIPDKAGSRGECHGVSDRR